MEFDKTVTTLVLLTPLLLGLAALVKDFITRKDKKPEPAPRTGPNAVVQGMTVPTSDFAKELIAELKSERAEDKEEIRELKAKLQAYREMDRKE